MPGIDCEPRGVYDKGRPMQVNTFDDGSSLDPQFGEANEWPLHRNETDMSFTYTKKEMPH